MWILWTFYFEHPVFYLKIFKCPSIYVIITGCNLRSEKFWLLGRNSLRWVGTYATFKLLTSVGCLLVIICDKSCCIADINACIPSILIVYHQYCILYQYMTLWINIYRLMIHIALICCILLHY